MKQFIKLFGAFITLLGIAASLLSFAAVAEGASVKPQYLVDFSAERQYEVASQLAFAAPGASTMEWCDHSAKFTASSDNANWSFYTQSNFQAENASYLKLRIKNESPGDIFELWASASDVVTDSLEINMQFYKIETKGSGWREYIFVIDSECMVKGSWEGAIKRIRIDFAVSPSPAAGDYMEIDYIAMFSTEDEAKAFDIEKWEAANPAKPCGRWLDVNAAYPSCIFDLRAANKEQLEKMTMSIGSNGTIEYFDTYVTLTATKDSANPSWTFNLPELLDTNVCRYIKFSVKNDSNVGGFEMWYAHQQNAKTLRKNTLFKIETKDSEFQTYIFCVDDAYSSTEPSSRPYQGSIGTIRLDFMDTVAAMNDSDTVERAKKGEQMSVEYVAYFATLEQAEVFDINAYRAGQAQKSVTVDIKLPAPAGAREPLSTDNEEETTTVPEEETTTAPQTEEESTTVISETTADNAEETTVADKVDEPKKGCASVGGIGIVSVLSIAAIPALLYTKKRIKK